MTTRLPLGDIDLERTGSNSTSALPRLQKDPFGIDSDDNSDIETLNNSKYSQVLDSQSSLKGYNVSTNSFDDLNSEDYESSSKLPLNGEKKRSSKSRRNSSFGPSGNNRRRRAPIKPPKASIIAMVIIVPILVVIALFILLKWSSPSESKNVTPGVAPTGLTYPSGFNIKNNWGTLSPYFDTGANFPGIDSSVNEGISELPPKCSLKQVHILHRHAERYPTTGSGNSMAKTAEKLKNLTEPAAKTMDWLEQWEYTLGKELLVSRGLATEFAAGANFWASHGVLLFGAKDKGRFLYDPILNVNPDGSDRPPVVIRATSQSRIHQSADAWAAGFFGIYGHDPKRSEESLEKLKNPKKDIYNLVLQTEATGYNATLAGYYSCPNSNNATYVDGGRKMREWIDVYLEEAVIRISKLFSGLEEGQLTPTDIYNLQNICVYESAAYGSSPFCKLFTEKEWRGYEYAADLVFYGMASHGTPVGASEGAGWVYELVSRLEGKLITEYEAGWGVNTTLTSSEEVFPTNQVLYLDMSHDSVIVSVLTALGLDILKEDLPSSKILAPRQFVVSRLAPFGARLFVEVLSCEEDIAVAADRDNKKETIEDETDANNDEFAMRKFVRVKLNNRVLPLGSLKACPANKEGLCPFDDFIESLKFALEEIDFDRNCYGIPEGY
ncbi:uncharacterized protein SAPINGB_P002654 [Magnusiomyces paraingens]|uniref:Acid phosphatase n=1 Tax=Magnusiomyces paraingens TaxID=2606893 RepID=A0A5E8BKT0_9ASCO|nr:uncharacterized protein SAPINGB_P002654 [Saprochaete ingens]VVT50207.1 unnamed protein product [Saprochaete ingens]